MRYVEKFLKGNKIQTECEIHTGDIWQSVDIDFLNDKKKLEETSFDVAQVLSKNGQSVLSQLFDDFCIENNFSHPEIVSITVVKSAWTYMDIMEEN